MLVAILRVHFQGFQVRQHPSLFRIPPNTTKERPTRSGRALRLNEWDTLLKIRELQERLPELKTAKPCCASVDHANQLDYLNCIECNPFGLGLDSELTV